MSTALPAVDLSTVQVGSTGDVEWKRDTVQQGGSTGLGSGKAYIRLYNESGCGLSIAFASGGVSDRMPAGAWHIFEIPAGCLSLTWEVEYILPGANVSMLLPTVYSAGEKIPGVPVLGNSPVGVGGSVATTGTTSVVNDGQNAPTEVVEATPKGAASSQLLWNNDGSGKFGGGLDSVDATGKLTLVADAIAPAAIAGGALDTDVTVLASQIQLDGTQADETFSGAGDLFLNHGLHVGGSVYGSGGVVTIGDKLKLGGGWDTTGLTFPGSQVAGDIAASQVGPGALDTDVTVAPANLAGSGATPTGWTALASQIISDATVSPDSTFPGPDPYYFNAKVQLSGGIQPQEADGGEVIRLHYLTHNTQNVMAWEAEGGAVGIGYAFIYTDSGGSQRYGFVLYPDGSGAAGANAGGWSWDASGNITAPAFHGTADHVPASGVTSPPWADMTGSGATAGTKIWEGPIDPGASAAEGDIWCDA